MQLAALVVYSLVDFVNSGLIKASLAQVQEGCKLQLVLCCHQRKALLAAGTTQLLHHLDGLHPKHHSINDCWLISII